MKENKETLVAIAEYIIMNEFQGRRRRQAQEDLGLTTEVEQKEIDRALEKEESRKARKEARMMEIEDSTSYQLANGVATCMDKWFIDPILGFFIPGLGDVLTSFCVIPFIYVSAFKVRSLPLTLAVIYNVMIDVLVGLIPMYIGAICDVFNKAYVKNARLITGFVEDDKDIIEEVNSKAIWMGVMIGILCLLIYFMVKFVVVVTNWFLGVLAWLSTLVLLCVV